MKLSQDPRFRSKSVHRRFVHSTFQTRGDYTPTRATQCANVVWSDLVPNTDRFVRFGWGRKPLPLSGLYDLSRGTTLAPVGRKAERASTAEVASVVAAQRSTSSART